MVEAWHFVGERFDEVVDAFALAFAFVVVVALVPVVRMAADAAAQAVADAAAGEGVDWGAGVQAGEDAGEDVDWGAADAVDSVALPATDSRYPLAVEGSTSSDELVCVAGSRPPEYVKFRSNSSRPQASFSFP